MQLDPKFRSVVRMERSYIKEIQFQRSPDPIQEADLHVRFERSCFFNMEKTQCTVELSCHISEPDDRLRCTVTMCGIFSCPCAEEAQRVELLERNTTAILFPYLRSQVSLVTAQPDLTPIVLPAMNINAFFDKKED